MRESISLPSCQNALSHLHFNALDNQIGAQLSDKEFPRIESRTDTFIFTINSKKRTVGSTSDISQGVVSSTSLWLEPHTPGPTDRASAHGDPRDTENYSQNTRSQRPAGASRAAHASAQPSSCLLAAHTATGLASRRPAATTHSRRRHENYVCCCLESSPGVTTPTALWRPHPTLLGSGSLWQGLTTRAAQGGPSAHPARAPTPAGPSNV